MKNAPLCGALLAMAGCFGAPGAQASPQLVATIYGVYDANSCGDSASCLSAPPTGTLAANYASNGGSSFDSPSLFINNDTPYSFSNVEITLNAYQGINNVSSTVIPVGVIPGGTIAANTLFQVIWSQGGDGTGNAVPGSGSNPSANLFSFDYDDYYGGNSGAAACTASGGQGTSFCQSPGNFDVTFTATWNNPAFGATGTPISALFSPDPTQGNGNAAGTFVGWEGLDPTGLAETAYDNHTSAVAGVLQYIYVGTPNQIVTTPEPASLLTVATGLGALGLVRRRRKSA